MSKFKVGDILCCIKTGEILKIIDIYDGDYLVRFLTGTKRTFWTGDYILYAFEHKQKYNTKLWKILNL